MTKLQFTIPPIDGPTRSAPALPINVHRSNDFAIVSRTVTDQDLSLEPGEYVAVVEFPDGRESCEAFHLKPGTGAVELLEIAKAIRSEAAATPPKGAAWDSSLPYDFIDFNPFSEIIEVYRGGPSRKFRVQQEVKAPSGDRWRYLAVAPEIATVSAAERKTFLVAIPAAEEARVTITVNLDQKGRPRPDFEMPRVAATMLYRYASQLPEAAIRLSGSAQLCALDLVENKAEDPVSGALAMYLLLGANRLADIGGRSEKLYRYNRRLADGAVIWAEHLARTGNHKEAVATLASLKERGIPVLTAGFRMALSRISTYMAAGLGAAPLLEINNVLRYCAERAIVNSPTTVIELDATWSAKVREKLAT
jgi:hypothetical protein